MDVKLLTGAAVARALEKLIETHEEVHWAVAWGTYSTLARSLFAQPAKIRAVTFGLAFAQTDPDLVDAMVGRKGCRVVTSFPKGTYHPKVYAFQTGDRVEAVLGSANFTQGGLGRNHEASVLISGTTRDALLADLLAFTARSAKLGKPVSRDLADRYRLSCKIAARKPRPTRDPLDDVPEARVRGLASPITRMNWEQYLRALEGPTEHDIDQSLALLRTAQGWLSAGASFGALRTPQRKAIAGVIGMQDRALDEELDQDWGWFGSMRGAGDFMNRVAENDRFLAKAIDSIPHRGEITRDHYERFSKLFVDAFRDSDRTGNVPTASRLLAMKRPDVFLCVSKPNRAAAAEEMGFARSTLRLENYWDRVVEVIRASEWYNTSKPDGREGQIWECRAALLDALLYRPG